MPTYQPGLQPIRNGGGGKAAARVQDVGAEDPIDAVGRVGRQLVEQRAHLAERCRVGRIFSTMAADPPAVQGMAFQAVTVRPFAVDQTRVSERGEGIESVLDLHEAVVGHDGHIRVAGSQALGGVAQLADDGVLPLEDGEALRESGPVSCST